MRRILLVAALAMSAAANAASLLDGFWFAVNDNVMGGVSRSGISIGGGRMVFSGHVSLENNGGFASVRREVPGLAGDAIRFRVHGDGRRYRLTASPEARSTGLQYSAAFDAAPGQWTTVKVLLSDMRASFRGRPLPDAPVLKAGDVRAIGFIVGDGQSGDFRLEVEQLAAAAE